MSGTAAADWEREEEASSAGLSANARPRRRRHLARHRLFRKCDPGVVGIWRGIAYSENAIVGALYLVAGVRPRNAPTMTKGIGAISWSNSVRSALREHAPGAME